MSESLDNALLFVRHMEKYNDKHFMSKAMSRMPMNSPFRISLTCFSSNDGVKVSVSRLIPLTGEHIQFILDAAELTKGRMTISSKGDADVDF